MARKGSAELRAAVQALAPARPAEQDILTPEQRERVKALLVRFRERFRSAPRPQPLERWKRILADPKACQRAHELAREAIAAIEGKADEVERIAIEAEIQETARRIARQLGEKEDDERAGSSS